MNEKEWATPQLRHERDENNVCKMRGHEIQDWLDHHPEVTDYKIIDDDQDMLEHQMKKLIHTDGENGMTFENIRTLLRWAGVLKS